MLPADAALKDGSPIEIGVRPDAIAIDEAAANGSVRGGIVVIERLGGADLVHVRVAGLAELIIVEQRGTTGLGKGQPVGLRLDPLRVHLFEPDGRRI